MLFIINRDIHWVTRQNKLEIPIDKDDVNIREIRECDGRAHDPDTMVVPLTPKPTRKAEALARAPPTIVSSRKEDADLKEVSLSRYRCANCILETKTKVGSTTAKAPDPRTNPNINVVPTAPKSVIPCTSARALHVQMCSEFTALGHVQWKKIEFFFGSLFVPLSPLSESVWSQLYTSSRNGYQSYSEKYAHRWESVSEGDSRTCLFCGFSYFFRPVRARYHLGLGSVSKKV